VKSPQPIDLYETITLTLQPLTTGAGCSTSAVSSYAVLLDAPGFTVDRIGAAERTREALLAPSCSLAAQAPLAPAPWRWNLMPTLPGNHVITLVLQALDKHGAVLNTREDDIPVIVLGQRMRSRPTSASPAVWSRSSPACSASGRSSAGRRPRRRPRKTPSPLRLRRLLLYRGLDLLTLALRDDRQRRGIELVIPAETMAFGYAQMTLLFGPQITTSPAGPHGVCWSS